MYLKNSYTREIIVVIGLVLSLFMSVYFLVIPTYNNYKNAENTVAVPRYVIAKNYDDTKVNYALGISEVLHDIDVEPIYQTTQEETIEEETVDQVVYDFELTGYISVNTELNVRKQPDKESEILSKLNWMDEVKYSIVDDEWAVIQLDDEYGYIALKYITDTKEDYKTAYQVTGDKAKTYMDYRTITDKKSNQYRLQLRASTCSENGLRLLRDRYMVAIGSYFGCTVGQYIDVVLSDGEVLECIVGDAKQDIHTDGNNLHGLSGDTVEFIVDEPVLKDTTDVVGNISDVSDTFDGKVVEIRKYDHIEH